MRRLVLISVVLWTGGGVGSLQAEQSLVERARSLLLSAEVVEPFVVAPNEDCKAHLLLCNQVIETSLTNRDCSLSDGEFGDLWIFPSYHAQAAAVGVRPQGFDALFGITDSSSRVYDVDVATSGTFETVSAFLTRPGNYHVPIFSYETNVSKTGDYRLILVCTGTTNRCTGDVATLCLQRNRFAVQVAYENQFDGSSGFGRAIKRTDEAGFFAFGDANNIELLVKVLNFGGGTYKVFFGQLTNLRFQLAVTDTVTGRTKTYSNTSGECGGIDQNFAAASVAGVLARVTAPCRRTANVLCLGKSRFSVEVDWRNQYSGVSGHGGAVPISDITGAFYFGGGASNLELLTKAVDLGDRIAFFWGALSDLEYTIRVTDSVTGSTKTYQSPAGRFCGGLDNTGFPR